MTDSADLPPKYAITDKEVTYPPPEISQADCDHVLGAYMRAWNQVELVLSGLFDKLLGAGVVAASIIFQSGINAQTMREIIGLLSKERMDLQHHNKLEAMLRRTKDATTKRNRIIHGMWQLEFEVRKDAEGINRPVKSTWVRMYMPADGEVFQKMYKEKNAKVIAAHRFTPEQIAQAAKDLHTLARDLSELGKSAALRPFRTPQPVKWN